MTIGKHLLFIQGLMNWLTESDSLSGKNLEL